MVMAALMLLAAAPVVAQTNEHPLIRIGGAVYGGGEEGVVGQGTEGAQNSVTVNPTDSGATYVRLYQQNVTTVFGGGLKGAVYGNTHVVIGRNGATSITDGAPAIEQNVYGGGYQGRVIGGTHVDMYAGKVGYYFPLTTRGSLTSGFDINNAFPAYLPKTWNQTPGDDQLNEAGNIFGGGYGAGATADQTCVRLFGGEVRNSVYGGGEIATVGRLKATSTTGDFTFVKGDEAQAGLSVVQLYEGHVGANVFAGGRGYAIGQTVAGSTDGYVFGHTQASIYGGTVGNPLVKDENRGNVFGGGNLGFVFSTLGTFNASKGYYYYNDRLTEDCKVNVAPKCRALEDVTIGGNAYKQGDYVPQEDLNTLTNNDEKWALLDQTGVTISGAVFAGGNVARGSDKLYANTTTVFGNATASVVDLFSRDLVSLGGDGVGGIYGDGNLTLVNGYRGLNISNYGTDYHYLQSSLSLDQFQSLTPRQRTFYATELSATSAHDYDYYEWLVSYSVPVVDPTWDGAGNWQDHITGSKVFEKGEVGGREMLAPYLDRIDPNWTNGVDGILKKTSRHFAEQQKIDYNEYALMDASEQANWQLEHINRYDGRMVNTLQRADFCGMFGSRLVMKGALDRATDEVDYTLYTVNRVGEISLNRVTKALDNGESQTHGNYFGIYSVVNYLGALTSDVKMRDPYRADDQTAPDATDSYFTHKEKQDKRKANIGTSQNEVGVASGVWLEMLIEPGSKWFADSPLAPSAHGPHRVSAAYEQKNYGPVTGVFKLDLLNVAPGEGGGYVYARNIHGVATADHNRSITVSDANRGAESFWHFTYTDAFGVNETSGNFVHPNKTIKDDCYPEANKESSKAHYWYLKGNYYIYDQYVSAFTGAANAYKQTSIIPLTLTPEAHGRLQLITSRNNHSAYWETQPTNVQADPNNSAAILLDDASYTPGDPISDWTYNHLADEQKAHFVNEPVYVCAADFTGLDGKQHAQGDVVTASSLPATATDADGNALYYPANAVNNQNGYLLTLDWDNPEVWNRYYQSKTTDLDQLPPAPADYIPAPTFKCKEGEAGVYGQLAYKPGQLIDSSTYGLQAALGANAPTSGQATFAQAYAAKETFVASDDQQSYVKGACISADDYNLLAAADKAKFAPAYICNNSYLNPQDNTETYVYGDVMNQDEWNALTNADAQNSFQQAYICTGEGKWGGQYFATGQHYEALDICNLTETERAHFTFDDNALDLLRGDFTPDLPLTDRYTNPRYTDRQPIDYNAKFIGYTDAQGVTQTTLTLTHSVPVMRNDVKMNTNIIQVDDSLDRETYEAQLVNEQRHYVPLVYQADAHETLYVINSDLRIGDGDYVAGNTISLATYNNLTEADRNKVTIVTPEMLNAVEPLPTTGTKTYYFCREALNNNNQVGDLITQTAYQALTNEQVGFTITGVLPTETSTLYVARETDLRSLSKDKIVTVEYRYNFMEGNASGTAYEEMVERHIINIHIHFESGSPTIGKLLEPMTVLPGSVLSLNQPSVTRGAYEVVNAGWELFGNKNDAEAHVNGRNYDNYKDSVWYDNNTDYIAYYAKTYLGRTYSNAVPVSVANYHHIKDVLEHPEHYHLDRAVAHEKRPKVYLTNPNDLSYFAQYFNHSYDDPQLTHAKGGKLTDFILRSNQDAQNSWTPLGSDTKCFEGTLHGDGYKIEALNNALFAHLCGKVYNLGLTGDAPEPMLSQSGGAAEDCWSWSTGDAGTGAPLIGGTADQLTNCYYRLGSTTATATGATPQAAETFVTGKTAFNLNRYYLDERYRLATNGTAPNGEYIRSRYSNGDFRYQEGFIPKTQDRRYNEATMSYDPIYPDDYVMFGQTLSYGLTDAEHDDQPAAIRRLDGEHGFLLVTDETANRVMRAPAYYMSKTAGEAYFNPEVCIAGSYQSKLQAEPIEPYMRFTAIDFTGYQDNDHTNSGLFLPRLDYTQSLTGWHLGNGASRNTLVYIRYPYVDDQLDNNGQPLSLSHYLSYEALARDVKEQSIGHNVDNDGYVDHFHVDDKPYQCIDRVDPATVNGHLVELRDPWFMERNDQVAQNEEYMASYDHLLVEDNNFNCPIPVLYFQKAKNLDGADEITVCHQLWHQYTPQRYASGGKQGWETICLPFTARFVTTHQKGMLSHFYNDGTTAGTIKHEYWLRGFVGGEDKDANDGLWDANFTSPVKTAADGYAYPGTTFLWDYYYAKQPDANTDVYDLSQRQSGSQATGITGDQPYIVAFPNDTFKEFDLSGTFVPQNVQDGSLIATLEPQTISFVADTQYKFMCGSTDSDYRLGVSDDQPKSTTEQGYTFKGTYQKDEIAAGSYLLNSDGSAFERTAASTAKPFRAWFEAKANSRQRGIRITNHEDGITMLDTTVESLRVWPEHNRVIAIENHTKQRVTLQLHTTAGQLVQTVTVEPNDTRRITAPYAGIYIIAQKKVAVK